MKLVLRQSDNDKSHIEYNAPEGTFPDELLDQELTYGEYIALDVQDAFLDMFFSSELSEPSWYRDKDGRLVYRKVIRHIDSKSGLP